MDKYTYLIPLVIIGCLLFLYFFRQEEVVPDVVESKEVEFVKVAETPVYAVEVPKKEDGYFSSWSEWSECNKTCGGGIQYRSRTYTPAKYGGIDLEDKDNLLESRECNAFNCPENGYHTEWNEWGVCDKVCGGGNQRRERSYTPAKYGGLDLEDKDNTLESRNCNSQSCPIDGSFTPWEQWSDCSKSCGGGSQSRNRTYNPAKYGGVDLSEAERINLIENRNCNEQSCPVNGSLTEWNNWSSCDKPCGGGNQKRERSYVPAKFGGVELSLDERNNIIEIRNCNDQACPVNGSFSTWDNWSNCDKQCGGGTQSRNRTYTPATNGGVDLDDKDNLIETIKCNEQACPVNGYHSTWSGWSVCDKTCGGGNQSRNRTYIPAINGGVDLVDRNNLLETQVCNIQVCPVAYKFILTTDKYTSTPLSVTSPNGLYKFEWNNTPDLIVYKLINGTWSISSKITIWNSNNTSMLSCDTEGVSTYNSAYTTSSRLGSISSIKGSIKGFAINDNGQLVLIDYLGAIGLVISSPSLPSLTK
jgi:Thrombospondin type 1 domain